MKKLCWYKEYFDQIKEEENKEWKRWIPWTRSTIDWREGKKHIVTDFLSRNPNGKPKPEDELLDEDL